MEKEQRSYQFTIEEISRLCHVYQDICNRLPYIYHYDYRNKRSLLDYDRIRSVENELVMDGYGRDDKSDFLEEELRSAENRTSLLPLFF